MVASTFDTPNARPGGHQAEANADGRRQQRRRTSTTISTPASRASTARPTPSPRRPGPTQLDGRRPRQGKPRASDDDCRGRPRTCSWFVAGDPRTRRHAPQAAKRLNVRQRFRRTRASSGRASGLPPPNLHGLVRSHQPKRLAKAKPEARKSNAKRDHPVRRCRPPPARFSSAPGVPPLAASERSSAAVPHDAVTRFPKAGNPFVGGSAS